MQTGGASPTAVVIAGDEVIRVLLRGLLRLHHYQIVGEAVGEEEGLSLLRDHSPQLLIADMGLADGAVPSLLAEARRTVPGLRSVIVVPHDGSDGSIPTGDEVDAVLQRPFRVRDFARAVGVAPAGSS